jgi:hypothetical protein
VNFHLQKTAQMRKRCDDICHAIIGCIWRLHYRVRQRSALRRWSYVAWRKRRLQPTGRMEVKSDRCYEWQRANALGDRSFSHTR